MKIVVTGASGLIGSALVPRFAAAGHDVVPLTRPAGWDPERGTVDRALLEGAEAVVNLAGEPVFGRWTAEKKRRIRESRVHGTRLLCDTIAALARPPVTLLSASAIGYYGNRGDEALTEASPAGSDFLAVVSRDWEGATEPAARAGVRVVRLRLGVVLSPEGGALGKMLPPFRLGLGGPVGGGKQYVSWIAMEDLLEIFAYALATPALEEAVNCTAPQPVTNREFAAALGHVLGRPALVPVPAFALRMAFGADGAEMLTGGQRVLPARLLAAGFRFRYVEIEGALRAVLS